MERQFLYVRRVLESVEETRSQVARLRRSVRFLEAKCTSGTSRYGIRGAGDTAGPEAMWTRLCDQREKLNQQEKKLADLERLLSRWIDQLPRPRWRMVLRCRYLDGLALQEVAEELTRATGREFSMHQVYRLHREALGAAEALWPIS